MRLRALSGVAFAVAISLVAAGLAPSAAAEPSDPEDAPSGPTISGTVSLEAGAPAEWLGTVQVSAQSADGENFGWAAVDPETGEYSLTNLEPNDYRLQFSSYATWTEAGDIVPNLVDEYYDDTTDWASAELITVNDSDVQGIDATLAIGRTISGRVELPQEAPSEWLQGVTVNASAGTGVSRSASVDPSTGEYTISGLSSDEFRVQFSASSFWVDEVEVTPNLVAEYYDDATNWADATLVAVTDSDASGIDAALSIGRAISGKVTIPGDVPAEWLKGVAVGATNADGGNPGYSASVDDVTGEYTIFGVAPGRYNVQFYALTYWAEEGGVRPNLLAEYFDDAPDLLSASPVDVTMGDVTGIDAELTEGRSISGTVTIPVDAEPDWLASVRVTASGEISSSIEVDPQTGEYELTGLSPGVYEVRFASDPECYGADATCPNLLPEYYDDALSAADATPVDVTGESLTGIDAALGLGTVISGTVTLPPGAPIEWLNGVRVAATPLSLPSTGSSHSVDPATGEYRIAGLPPGPFHVQFFGSSYWSGGEWYPTNLVPEYFDDAANLMEATIVDTTAQDQQDIDAALDYGGTLSGEVDVSALREIFPDNGFAMRLTDETGLIEVTGWGDGFFDDKVTFSMPNLRPGTYRLAVDTSSWDEQTGKYTTTSSQFLRFGSQSSITLKVGETKQNLRLVARKPDAVLSGTMITAGLSDAPIDGILASALVYERVGNEWARMPAARFDTNTDGLTPYRIAVPSGTYTVGFETDFATTEVSAAEQWWRGKQSLASATPIVVGSGVEASGINGALGGVPFSDTAGHDFYAEIAWLASTGVTRGWTMPDGSVQFRPQQPILRGEMAAFLYRLAGEPEFDVPAESPFVDVSTDHVFFKEIAWLAAEEISRGWDTPRGVEFRAESSTARDVMAAFLYRYQQEPAYSPEAASPFRDVAAGRVFYPEIRWLAAEGISTGWDVGAGCREYRPMQNVLRSEMAAFLFRMENGGTLPITSSSCRP